jgi:prepilin-type N-terminal cleavage/methylation domain-containing protein
MGGRGFSLVEMLAVVAIVAILFVIGGQGVGQAWKRQKLSSAATDVKILFQRALPEMQRRGMTTFVQVGPRVTNASVTYVPVYLIGDANADGQITAGFANPAPAGGDLLIDEYDVMVLGKTGVKGTTGAWQEFSFSVDDITQIQSNLWLPPPLPPAPPALPPAPCAGPFCDDPSWNVGRGLQCDFQGRAIDLTSGRQLVGPATLVLTHVGVVNGSFQPATRYVLSINPVWSVRIRKQIRDASNVWVDQLGG